MEKVREFYSSLPDEAVVGIEASGRAAWFENMLACLGYKLLVGNPVLIRERATPNKIMKRCPECRRDYYDDTLSFCLEDGTPLVQGSVLAPQDAVDEPATAILSEPGAVATGFLHEESKTALYQKVDERSAAKSIAVLPFVNMSADAENEYFCDGLAEELLNALAKIEDLKVAARTSAFSFKGKNTNVGEVGRALGVRSVLEGSVRKSGERLRITVQLVNAADGYHIWSERYDREMRDIFDLQDEITLAVVDALKLKLLGNVKINVLKRETENTEAYKAYLKGRYLRFTKNDHHGASIAYEEAVRLDPLHAPSWVGLGETFVLRSHYGIIQPIEACSRARAALTTAKEIQGESGEALYVEGFVAFVERDWLACEIAYRRSLEIDPNNPRALGTFGIINCVLGKVDEALILFGRARESDPLASYPYAMTGAGLVMARRSEEAMPFFEQAFAFEKDQTLALWTFCIAKIALGKFDEGIAAAERSVAVSRRTTFFLGLLGWALAEAGRTDEAKSILDEIRNRPTDSPMLPFEVCIVSALGDNESAFVSLTRAVDEYSPMTYYLGLPCYDRLRDDPRFSELRKQMNLPE
ncbi:MAG: tetratricopeptide repeat protein [Pyrinomonadaceae bacterium]